MNPKLEGIVERFANNKGLEGDIALKYEHFANYIILRDEYYKFNESYPYESNVDKELLEHIDFGKNSTESIDGFFCLIQNSPNIIHIDTTKDEIEEWIKGYKKVKFRIVLIQTKKGNIDPKNINDLNVILETKDNSQSNWKKFFSFRDTLSQIIKDNPNIKLDFSIIYTIGNNKDLELLKNPGFTYKITALKKTMKEFFWLDTDEFVNVEIYDGQDVLKLYDIQSKSLDEIDKIIDLALITGVQNCGEIAELRFGTIKISEFKKMIYDFDIDRPYQLYEYNVRHNLESTPVNAKILETLGNTDENIKFPLLNNGVTIIVDSMNRKGGDSTFELKNIRIVNGCQTSHAILKKCIKSELFDEVVVPIKIIGTKNEDILSEITYSSNNQNPIQPENLISINKNIILLEKEYHEFNIINEKTLKAQYLFERRQGQYFTEDKKFVIDIPDQAKVFLSAWLLKPHIPLQYKDKTLEEFRKLIDDVKEDELQKFFNLCILSGILWCKIYNIIKTSFIIYEPGRFHILTSVIFYKIKSIVEYSTDSIPDEKKLIELYLSKYDDVFNCLLPLIGNNEELNDIVKIICAKIDSMDNITKNANGRIHYRKFYPINIVIDLINKVKD